MGVVGEDGEATDFTALGDPVNTAARLAGDGAPGIAGGEAAIASVAAQLRNTKAVCRKCYVHPAVIDAYLAGGLHAAMRGLRDEAGVIRLLKWVS